jgi:hypothetical protein
MHGRELPDLSNTCPSLKAQWTSAGGPADIHRRTIMSASVNEPKEKKKTSFLIIRLICLRGCLFEQWFDFVRATINFAIV